MIGYTRLLAKLTALEGQVPGSPASRFRSAGYVRTTKPPVQAYGLDRLTKTVEGGLPVIVAIGGNYTQRNEPVPRDAGPSLVEDDLQKWRNNLKTARLDYVARKSYWSNKCAVSPRLPVFPENFHFVMTNFCLWITKDECWQDLRPEIRADLLDNNPPFGGKSTTPSTWAHLAALAETLKKADVTWIAHGIHCEIFALFRQFMRSINDDRWILLPNLSRPYNYRKLW